MISFEKLVVLSEASKGYIASKAQVEGEKPLEESVSYENPYPNLTLNECMSLLTTTILETQIELYRNEGQTNEALVEAAVNAITTKSEANYTPIYETAGEKLKEVAAHAWDVMKKAAMAIFNWIKDLILKLKGNTDQLLDRQKLEAYKAYTGSFDVTVRAGLFEDPSKFFKPTGTEESIDDIFGGAIADTELFSSTAASVVMDLFVNKAEAETIKEAGAKVKPSQMEGFAAARLLNIPGEIDTTEPNWELKVRQYIFGEEKTFTYNKDLKFDKIEAIIKDHGELATIQKTYGAVIQELQKSELEFTKALAKVKEADEKGEQASEDLNKEPANNADLVDCLNIYMRWYTGVVNAVNKVSKLHVAFVNERYAASAKILRGILKGQGKEAMAAKVQNAKDAVANKVQEKKDAAAAAKAEKASAKETKEKVSAQVDDALKSKPAAEEESEA